MLVYIVYNTNVNAVYAVYESESDANNTKDSMNELEGNTQLKHFYIKIMK